MSSPIGRGFPLGNTAWPVGSIFISVANTNPNILLGYGTWVAFATGRTLVGIDVSQTEFDTVEETGGAKTHTLTTTEIPSHAHAEQVAQIGDPSLLQTATRATGAGSIGTNVLNHTTNGNGNGGTDGINTGNTGGGGAHNNLQPYIVVYMWKRVS